MKTIEAKAILEECLKCKKSYDEEIKSLRAKIEETILDASVKIAEAEEERGEYKAKLEASEAEISQYAKTTELQLNAATRAAKLYNDKHGTDIGLMDFAKGEVFLMEENDKLKATLEAAKSFNELQIKIINNQHIEGEAWAELLKQRDEARRQVEKSLSAANSWDRVFDYVSTLDVYKETESKLLQDNCQSLPVMVIKTIEKLNNSYADAEADLQRSYVSNERLRSQVAMLKGAFNKFVDEMGDYYEGVGIMGTRERSFADAMKDAENALSAHPTEAAERVEGLVETLEAIIVPAGEDMSMLGMVQYINKISSFAKEALAKYRGEQP